MVVVYSLFTLNALKSVSYKNFQVLCRSMSFQHGVAYHQSDNEFSPLLSRGPYWIGDVHCEGNEPSIDVCKFNDRLVSKNCTDRTNAAAVCYNDDGELLTDFNKLFKTFKQRSM